MKQYISAAPEAEQQRKRAQGSEKFGRYTISRNPCREKKESESREEGVRLKRLIYLFSAAIIMMSVVSVYGEDIREQPADARPNEDIREQPTEARLIEDMILYYGCYGEDAAGDIDGLLADLKETDIMQGELWEDIMDYWGYVHTDLVINTENLPENLPEDDSLALVILGNGLNDDGSMKEELIGRLEVGLDCAGQYPNAFVICTGGGTAKENKNVTEAGQMGDWLIEKGLEKDRLILEDRSRSTIENARFTQNILRKDYPQIDSIAIITSDYHIARASLLFETITLMMADGRQGSKLQVLSNCAWLADKEYTEKDLRGWEMYNLLQLTGNKELAQQYIKDPENFPRPVLGEHERTELEDAA